MTDKIEETIKLIKQAFPYLFNNYGYKITYIAPDYGYRGDGVSIGLHSESFNYHLLFSREMSNTSVRVDMAHKTEAFEDYDIRQYKAWNYLSSITGILSGKQLKGIEDNNLVRLGANNT